MNCRSRASSNLALIAAGLTLVTLSSAARAEGSTDQIMPSAELNSVVQKYCRSCHSDALRYGGLSVEHFDAAHPDPTMAAMLVSKLTNGQTPEYVNAAMRGPDAEATISGLMEKGAMGAAGKGVPDKKTQVALVEALSAEAAGAQEWHSSWDQHSRTDSPQLTASVLREIPSTVFAGKTDMYRLILTCGVATHEGEIQLAWANGVPDEGREMKVEVDGKAPFAHKVEGGKKQGNGVNGPGATVLYPGAEANITLPTQNLTISEVFPDETVVFSFENLSPTVRRDLSMCFAGGRTR